MRGSTKNLWQFFLLSYAVSWSIWLPLYLPYWGIDGLPVLPFQHALGALGPFIAAALMTFITEGKKGLAFFAKRLFTPIKLLWLTIALVAPFLLLLLAMSLDFVINGVPVILVGIGHTNEFPAFSPLVYFLYNLVFFGYGEEAGWRGFALPRLQQRFNALTSSLIFTFFWMLWHWPLFLYRPGYVAMDIAGMTGWVFSLITGSILLTWLFNSSRGSIMACAILHAAIDVVFISDNTGATVTNYLGMLITCWGIVTVFIVGYSELCRRKRIKKL